MIRYAPDLLHQCSSGCAWYDHFWYSFLDLDPAGDWLVCFTVVIDEVVASSKTFGRVCVKSFEHDIVGWLMFQAYLDQMEIVCDQAV